MRRTATAAAIVLASLAVALPAQATQYGPHEAHGLIEGKYLQLGGPRGFLGYPDTDELGTPDGIGRFNHFHNGGSIYWTNATGAHEVHGAIRWTWQVSGWEAGPLGYPTSDEAPTPDGGRFNVFQRGFIYWSPATGAHEVYGAILGLYASLGYEQSILGYPISGEYQEGGARRTDFQRGSIQWTPDGGAVLVDLAVVPPTFRNCTDMHNGGYPHGVGLPGAVDQTSGIPVYNYYVSLDGYDNNYNLDADYDGIACEAR